ncbi:MAG: putative ABC transporter permease [Eubacteriales bacterium]|nr:putative ABC transporter permease [Eubacteriales bacterium]
MYFIMWLFLVYSFLGWIFECSYAAYKHNKFINRGVLAGPLLSIYGISAILIKLFLFDLSDRIVFLFIGSAIIYGLCELIVGNLLQVIFHKKWWDYSSSKFNISGFVNLRSLIIGGLLGITSITYLNNILINILNRIPFRIGFVILIVILSLFAIDIILTYFYVLGIPKKFVRAEKIHKGLIKLSMDLNEKIIYIQERRIKKAFPEAKEKVKKEKSNIFAKGCNSYKLFWLFIICSFMGDIIETIFCYITTGILMSRTSLVWGKFSIVWGIALSGGTWVLYNYREKSDSFLFLFGVILGGAFEYICSIFTELVFGQVFWDYSHIPFNLGGRINLLYCFFWGIASVIWLKKIYPHISKLIEKIPMKIGKIITFLMLIFIMMDLIMSTIALKRYDLRSSNILANNSFESWVDETYNDNTMKKIYPNGIKK